MNTAKLAYATDVVLAFDDSGFDKPKGKQIGSFAIDTTLLMVSADRDIIEKSYTFISTTYDYELYPLVLGEYSYLIVITKTHSEAKALMAECFPPRSTA